jgi:hypothetical protein
MPTAPKEENLMDSRVFDDLVTAFSMDGSRLESFNRGEHVRNIHRFGTRVIFEPVSAHRVAATYAMDWSEFERKTTIVRQAHV